MGNIIKEITAKPVYQAVWQNKDLHILQSWDWGTVKENEGWKIIRLGLFPADDAENPAEIISLQLKPLPVIGKYFAYVPKLASPVWMQQENQKKLQQYFKNSRVAFIIYEFDKLINPLEIPGDLGFYRGHVQPQQTDQVALEKSEEDLFMQLDGKYRRNIKKSIREGVFISQYQYSSENNTEPVNAFYRVMQSIFSNTKFMEREREYFQTVWNSLGADDYARIFLAKKKNENGSEDVVGAYLVVNDNRGAYELYGGVNKTGRDVEAGYLLKWEAIRYFNSVGRQYYDHWGVAPKTANGEYDNKDELYQISRFKAGFGGNYLKFPEPRVQIFSPGAYKLFMLGKQASMLKVRLQKLLKG